MQENLELLLPFEKSERGHAPAAQTVATIPALTSIRFFLALWVVTYHQAGAMLSDVILKLPTLIREIVLTGYSPVSMFFLLSGFVMTHAYIRSDFRRTLVRAEFWVARLSRIYPTYAAGLLLSVPVILSNIQKGNSLWRDELFLRGPAAFLLIQSWLPRTALAWNASSWSLSDEAFFYACFPFCIYVLRRCSIPKVAAFALTVWLGSVGLSMMSSIIPNLGLNGFSATALIPITTWSEIFQYNPLFHLPDFLVGIVTAILVMRLRQQVRRTGRIGPWLYGFGFGAWAVITIFADHIPFPLMHNGLLLPAYAAIIAGLALGGGALPRVLSWRPLQSLGHASYALYILHLPLAHYCFFFSERATGQKMHGAVAFCVYSLTAIGVSLITFYFFEKPVNRICRSAYYSWNANKKDPKNV